MAIPETLPPLLPVSVAGIPASMLDTPRWAPWRAEWLPKKRKYSKIPHKASRPEHGLSNKSTKGWASFHEAMAAYQANPEKFAGVGYLMTGAQNLAAIDLDHCVVDGEVAPWAHEVMAKLDSYTEVSPSGTGLRIMIEAEGVEDWTNHERGIEVYGGQEARFVTITGAKLEGAPSRVRKPRAGVLDAITARYRKVKSGAEIEDLHLPPLLGDDQLPDLDEMQLPPHARNFLLEGPAIGEDRSRALFAVSIALNQAGLTRQEVLSILEGNEHAMEVALDHRRQDYDKALRYLWKDHCGAGEARAGELRQLQLDEFDDEGPTGEPEGVQEAIMPDGQGPSAADDFDVLEDDFEDLLGSSKPAPPVKREKFAPVQAGTFVARTSAAAWLIKGVLPAAGLGVIYGDSGAGKTFYVMDQVAAVCRGLDWRGLKTKKGRAVYICAEGAAGFQRRLTAYAEFHGVPLEELDLGVITDVPSFMDKADIKALGTQLKKYGKIDLLVVDTYARVMVGGNENDAKDAGLVISHCELLHRLTGAMVLLVHHSGKDSSRGARGSGALRAAADMEVEVVKLRDYRAATITKMKDGEDGKEYAFRLQEVVLGQDEDGDNITSCVVESREIDTRARHQGKPLTARQQMVLTVLDGLLDLGGGGVHYSALKAAIVSQTPHDPDKKVDNRGRDASRDIETLVTNGVLRQGEGGTIEHAERAK